MNILRENATIIIYMLGLISVAIIDHYKIHAIEKRLENFENKYDILDRKIDKLNDSVIRLQTIIEEKLK